MFQSNESRDSNSSLQEIEAALSYEKTTHISPILLTVEKNWTQESTLISYGLLPSYQDNNCSSHLKFLAGRLLC